MRRSAATRIGHFRHAGWRSFRRRSRPGRRRRFRSGVRRSRRAWRGRAMWLRSVRTVPSNAGALVAALGRLTPDVLASLAEAASHDGCHLRASLATPFKRDKVTTFHLRWWHDRERSLTPALDGAL